MSESLGKLVKHTHGWRLSTLVNFESGERALAYLTITSVFAMMLIGCTVNSPKPTALAAPEFVPQSQPDSLAETGIGQDPTSGGIFLQWYSVHGAAGYKVFRADTTNESGLPQPFVVVVNASSASSISDTSAVDNTSLVIDKKYFYYVRAYASDGSMGGSSDTINYTLWPRVLLGPPNDRTFINKGDALLQWRDYAAGGYTVIRMIDASVFPPTYIWITPRFQIFGGTYTREPFDFDSTATDTLKSNHSYKWRVDRFNIDKTGRIDIGCRSTWYTFTVN